MAKLGKPPTKTKKLGRFGAPPELTEASTTLEAPEHAPESPTTQRKARRKTGRTIQFSTKVTSAFDEEFRELAFRNKLKHSELLEVFLETYKKVNR